MNRWIDGIDRRIYRWIDGCMPLYGCMNGYMFSSHIFTDIIMKLAK